MKAIVSKRSIFSPNGIACDTAAQVPYKCAFAILMDSLIARQFGNGGELEV
jgi:hypothetical protein